MVIIRYAIYTVVRKNRTGWSRREQWPLWRLLLSSCLEKSKLSPHSPIWELACSQTLREEPSCVSSPCARTGQSVRQRGHWGAPRLERGGRGGGGRARGLPGSCFERPGGARGTPSCLEECAFSRSDLSADTHLGGQGFQRPWRIHIMKMNYHKIQKKVLENMTSLNHMEGEVFPLPLSYNYIHHWEILTLAKVAQNCTIREQPHMLCVGRFNVSEVMLWQNLQQNLCRLWVWKFAQENRKKLI